MDLASPVVEWDTHTVLEWAGAAEKLGEPVVAALRAEEVDGESLLELTSEEIRDELKLSTGRRKALERAIAALKHNGVGGPGAGVSSSGGEGAGPATEAERALEQEGPISSRCLASKLLISPAAAKGAQELPEVEPEPERAYPAGTPEPEPQEPEPGLEPQQQKVNSQG